MFEIKLKRPLSYSIGVFGVVSKAPGSLNGRERRERKLLKKNPIAEAMMTITTAEPADKPPCLSIKKAPKPFADHKITPTFLWSI